MPSPKKILAVPVAQAALLMRIRRKLAQSNRRLRQTHSRGPARKALGMFYLEESGKPIDHNINLERFARELGVLRDHEVLE